MNVTTFATAIERERNVCCWPNSEKTLVEAFVSLLGCYSHAQALYAIGISPGKKDDPDPGDGGKGRIGAGVVG